ncbi:hypothetical protein NBRC111894_468 [Sporolactobacillus inulinus]|uniref:Uncharacterized protein n=1 Tax=Sporolactobacillus inulinus TaxID=2078 RepID=A0A4Y1Z7F0_9BACL|nr:hypothetical protein NBRC111894_468 [Sporolactobacillus inulinus]
MNLAYLLQNNVLNKIKILCQLLFYFVFIENMFTFILKKL